MRIVGTEHIAGRSEGDPATMHGWKVLQRQPIDSTELRDEVLAALNSRFSYGSYGDACFNPGLAIRYGDGPGQVDAIICLDCHHIYFYQGSGVERRVLSRRGTQRLLKLYPRLFPGRSAEADAASNEKVSSAMETEFVNRLASEAATQPNPISSLPATRP